MDAAIGIQIAVIVVCLLFAAFASASETALTGVRRSRIHQLAEQSNGGSADVVVGILKEPHRFLITLLVLNSLAIVVSTSMATELALAILPPNPAWVRAVATAFIMSAIVLLFADVTPKVLAIQNTERAALVLARPVRTLILVLRPITAVLDAVSSALVRLVGGSTVALDPRYSEEELRLLVDVGSEQGVLENEEREMIHGVFEFGDTLVREVMRPRLDVIALPADSTVDTALPVIYASGHSRIPVYDRSIDNVVGVLYVKDLLRLLQSPARPTNLRDLVRPPVFVAESQLVAQALQEMRAKKTHLAIVLDEYGGTAGIVSIEDILEEIVGDIQDEYDKERPATQRVAEYVYSVDGSVGINEVNELLHLEVQSDAFDTIGGLIYSQLGATPVIGASAETANLRATVEEMDGHRVRRVLVRRVPKPETTPTPVVESEQAST